jgi:ATP-dependent helicase/nuclease subunit A
LLELTDNQKRALTRETNVAVTAGAGSGKTRILVARYLDMLLKENIPLQQLLAITFTEKAAAEMIQRIRDELEGRIVEAATAKEKKRLLQLRDHLGAAYISTIHAFCMRLLREFPIEAGIDPDLTAMDNLQTTLLVSEVLEELFSDLDQEAEIWLPLFRQFDIVAIKEMLTAALSHRYEMQPVINYFLNTPVETIYSELVQQFFKEIKARFSDEDLRKTAVLIKAVLSSDLSKCRDVAVAQQLLEKMKNCMVIGNKDVLEHWQNLFSLADLLTTRSGESYKNFSQLGGKILWDNKAQNCLLTLSQLLTPLATQDLSVPDNRDYRIVEHLPVFYRLFNLFEARYTRMKQSRAQIDFTDMQLYLLTLLRHNAQLHREIKNRFRYVLVDEFQDTNDLQWQLISQLGDLNSNKFFIVGDVKQSIYGFRNADVRLFNTVKNYFIKNDKTFKEYGDVILEASFRFKQQINCFLNRSFNTIFKEANEWEVSYVPMETYREDSKGGAVELALLDDTGQASFIAERIKWYISEGIYNYGDMAILLRSRTPLPEIERQLRRYHIPFRTSGGLGFYQQQEIYDIYNISCFLLDPSDDFALIGVLRSPFVNLSDETLLYLGLADHGDCYWQSLQNLEGVDVLPVCDREAISLFLERARRWLSRRDRIGFSDLLREVCEESFYRATIAVDIHGDRSIANLDKIISKTAELEKSGFTALRDFALMLRSLILEDIEEGEAQLPDDTTSAVRIMTIHKAKGLEFPVVFLPYLDQKIKPMTVREVYFDEKWGIISGINKSFLLKLVQKQRRVKELAELKRLFYVGCTRARDCLVLSAGKIVPDTPIAWLSQALDFNESDLTQGMLNFDNGLKISVFREYKLKEIPLAMPRFDLETVRHLMVRQEDDSKKSPGIFIIPDGEHYSATQLMTFQEDRDSYFKRYHLGFFESDYEAIGEISDSDESPLLRGKVLHRYLELYPHGEIDHLFMEYEIYTQTIKQEIIRLIKTIAQSSHIHRFFSTHDFKTEIPVTMSVNRDYLTGTLDRIFLNEDGIWEIVDYKTNRITANQVEQIRMRYRWQMDIYALLISRLYPEQERVPITLYFIEPDEIFSREYNKEQIYRIYQEVAEIIHNIKSTVFNRQHDLLLK